MAARCSLVIPGVTSCLGCADLHRTDRDAAWPVLAVQLREAIAHADRPTLLATAALALGQLQQIIGAVRGIDPPGDPPATMLRICLMPPCCILCDPAMEGI